MLHYKKQEEIWKKMLKDSSVASVINRYNNPLIFQKELKDLIGSYSKYYKDIIEVGCETGATSFLLDESFNKTLLDLNPLAIHLSKEAFRKMNSNAQFFIATMFNMPFKDETYDIVFNSGVIEHFNKKERTRALKEYSRILRNNGVIIIGFPNHFCIPYRLAYIVRNYLLFRYKWPYPKEYKIYDMKDEISTNNLILERRIVISKQSIYNWWNFFKPVKWILKSLGRCINFEGYLTVLIIRKTK